MARYVNFSININSINFLFISVDYLKKMWLCKNSITSLVFFIHPTKEMEQTMCFGCYYKSSDTI